MSSQRAFGTSRNPNKKHQKQEPFEIKKATTVCQQQQECNLLKQNRKMNKKNLQNKQNSSKIPTQINSSCEKTKSSTDNQNSDHFNTSFAAETYSGTFNKNESSSSGLKAKFWDYLLDNLQAAVGEIFQTCENEKSINKCNEVVHMLIDKTNEFYSLMGRILSFEMSLTNRMANSSIEWNKPKAINTPSNNSNVTMIHTSPIITQQIIDLNSSYNDSYSSNQPSTTLVTGFKEFLPFKDDEMDYYTEHNNNADEDGDDEEDESEEEITNKPICPTFIEPSILYPNTSQSFLSQPRLYQDSNSLLPSPIYSFVNHQQQLLKDYQSQQDQINLFSRLTTTTNFTNNTNNNIFSSLATPFPVNNSFFNWSELNMNMFNYDLASNLFASLSNTQSIAPVEVYQMNDESEDDYSHFGVDSIDKVMLKAYEDEENLVLEIEKVQNKELRSVLAQEAELTKQLSFQKHILSCSKYSGRLLEEDEEVDIEDTETENEEVYRHRRSKTFYIEEESANESEMDAEKVKKMHEKLLTMNRNPSPNERRRKHEEKQARAQEKREQFYQERSMKLRELTKKIEEVRELKKRLLKVKKATMKAKLQRAEEKRLYLLRLKANKAAVEEQKAHEIAFINNLVAQNRRHDILEKYEKRHENIRQNIEEERLRKQEEQKAKEQAAELRRQEIEQQRKARLKQMLEKRQLKQTKIEQALLEKEKERIETAKAKERTREIRLATIEQRFQANKQKVKRRMLLKQEESSKRHESNLEDIRKKALEMSILHFSTDDNAGDAPTPVPYEKAKFCRDCNVVIKSDVQLKSHLRGIKHQQTMNERNQGKTLSRSEIEEFNLKCIVDADSGIEAVGDKDKNRGGKKRVKKLRNRIVNAGIEYESGLKDVEFNGSLAGKSKVPKLLKNLNGCSDKVLDKIMGELNRVVTGSDNDLEIFCLMKGPDRCVKLLGQMVVSGTSKERYQSLTLTSPKLIMNMINLIDTSCQRSTVICQEFILTNNILTLLDLFNIHSHVMNTNLSPSSKSSHKQFTSEWLICSNLIHLLNTLFTAINNKYSNQSSDEIFVKRTFDVLSLMVAYGIIDVFSVFFSNIRGSLEGEEHTIQILQNCLYLLISLTRFLVIRKSSSWVFFTRLQTEDHSQLINTLKETNLVNIISMLYGMLHKDASTPIRYDPVNGAAEQTKKSQPPSSLELTTLSLRVLNQMMVLDVQMVQAILGEESLSLQLRHIASYLIWYLTTNKHDDLLHEILLLIGYFCVLNDENQVKMELGTPPTILQQLCNLPFNYFSDVKLISVLYPTLICYCYGNDKNLSVLATEVNTDLLAHFIHEKMSQTDMETSSGNKVKDSGMAFNEKYELEKRFPQKLWQKAFIYFSNSKTK